MITITRNISYLILGAISLAAFIISYFNSGNILISILLFLYFSVIPGSLILLTFKQVNLGFLKFILYSVGISIFCLMLMGLLFNWILLEIFHTVPLQKNLLLLYFGSLISFLLIMGFINSERIVGVTNLKLRAITKNGYFIIPPIFTALSIMSAIMLNNSNINFLAIFTLSGIALVILVTALLSRKINENFYPWSIYFFSLALLLIISMRSWYVSGWDIQNEFKLFQLTKDLGYWHPASWRDAYNACLSITLLPTIFSKLTSFPDEYIYKILYQILFAFTPVIVYQTIKGYIRPVMAYLVVIYIIAQPLFIQPMTALMRQEIAFLFFTLMIYVLFDNRISLIIRHSLFLIFGTGMIFSHYSTSYVAILLLLCTYFIVGIFRVMEKIKIIARFLGFIKIKYNNLKYSYFLNPAILASLFFLTIGWHGIINNHLGQVQKIATEGIMKMNDLFKTEVRSGESQKAISFLEQNETTNEQIESYSRRQIEEVGRDPYQLYSRDEYNGYNVRPMDYSLVQPLYFTPVNQIAIFTLELLKQIFKIIIICAPIYLFIRYFGLVFLPRELIIFCLLSIIIIVVMTIHPTLGFQYNLSRIYLQLLFYLALPAYLFLLFILTPFKLISDRLIMLATFLIFIYLVGIPNQLFGGLTKIYFNNYGEDYDKFFVHEEEIKSAEWIKAYLDDKPLLFSDREANLRLLRFTNFYSDNNILPSLLYKNAYVYGGYANTKAGITNISYSGTELVFSFPHKFLINNKNLIYSNGGSIIYK